MCALARLRLPAELSIWAPTPKTDVTFEFEKFATKSNRRQVADRRSRACRFVTWFVFSRCRRYRHEYGYVLRTFQRQHAFRRRRCVLLPTGSRERFLRRGCALLTAVLNKEGVPDGRTNRVFRRPDRHRHETVAGTWLGEKRNSDHYDIQQRNTYRSNVKCKHANTFYFFLSNPSSETMASTA